jgi:hypothetical protein
MANSSVKANSGRRGHHFARTERHVQSFPTAFDALARAALPGPQFSRRLMNLLDNSVPLNTLQAWRRGRRPAAQWALDRLIAACTLSNRATSAALEQTKKQPAQGGP